MNIPINNEPVILEMADDTCLHLKLVYQEESEEENGHNQPPESHQRQQQQQVQVQQEEQEHEERQSAPHNVINPYEKSMPIRHATNANQESSSSTRNANPEESFSSDRREHEEECNYQARDYHPIQNRNNSANFCAYRVACATPELNPRNYISNTKMLLRNDLENMLTAAMIKNMEAAESYKSIYTDYNVLTETLEFMAQYLDCLSVETRGLVRFCSHIDKFGVGRQADAPNEGCTFSKLLKQLSTPDRFNYQWLKKDIVTALANKCEINSVILEYADKKSDFSKATNNLRLIIDTNFSTVELKKLKKQFDLIQVKFQHSRDHLESKLPDVIASRKQLLINIFGVLGEDMQKFSNERSDFSLICQHLECALRNEMSTVNTKSVDDLMAEMEPSREINSAKQ